MNSRLEAFSDFPFRGMTGSICSHIFRYFYLLQLTIPLLVITSMIQFEKFTLANGLRVIVHQDLSTPMAVMDIMYDVGARDEDPNRTGFAHLFEHLMFGGSVNIPSYDEPLQMAGGENNAYTTNDLTNYYIQLPAENLETAFWLESDRMLSLALKNLKNIISPNRMGMYGIKCGSWHTNSILTAG